MTTTKLAATSAARACRPGRRARALLATVALLGAVQCAWSAPTPAAPLPAGPAQQGPAPNTFDLGAADSGAGALALLSEGRWARACAVAAGVLSRQVSDLEALGVFGICAASSNDRAAAATALTRLSEAEPAAYFAPLVRGVLALHDKSPAQARASFDTVLATRPADPLATYFVGEAQHAAKQDAQAIASFKAVLGPWPRFTPALTGAARLLAAPGAAQPQLVAARDLAERATTIDPVNLAHWRLLADLCDRTGQKARAESIRLQWLKAAGPPGAARLPGGPTAAAPARR